MNFAYTRKINSTFEMTLEDFRFALNDAGFGIVSNIDVSEKIVTKVNSDFGPYRILGVCNPEIAYKYLKQNLEYGVFLPCSVAIYEDKGSVFISAGMPEVMICQIIKNDTLKQISIEIGDMLKKVIDSI